MNLFEIALANCIRESRQENRQRHRADTTPSTTRAMITRLAAVAVVLSVAILALNTECERYERQLAIAVAATRQ
ncbi:hypothetical protein QO004_005441 [Rhizobium mesoamericanum]|uniref:hypothetical protein n=1 Tax=Rhizobium mesoamericanum TaxID=1079800 RepID=UPI0027850BB7|nr:hypothetical protein [Rhizobium mesoamericanum]MDQ0563626.1 hypothetical protein [Rhizobium mesoamericanum]